MVPGTQNGLGSRVWQFYTICDKNQLLKLKFVKVMAILVPRWLNFSWQVRLQMCLKFCMVKVANRTRAQTHSTITMGTKIVVTLPIFSFRS
jgi:hypothetical protein